MHPHRTIKNLSIISQADLDVFIKEDFKAKIIEEVRYSVLIFMGVYHCSMLIHFINNDICASANNFDFKNACELSIPTIIPVVRNLFIEEYTKGYQIGNCEQQVKNLFNILLGIMIEFFIPLIENYSKSGAVDYAGKNIMISQKELHNRIKRKRTSQEYIKMQFNKTNRKEIITSNFSVFDELFNEAKIKIEMQKYIQQKLKGIIKEGQAFRKNDIVDKMLLDELTDTDIIYTTDKDLCKFMLNGKDNNIAFKNSLNVISNLKIEG